MFRSSNCAHRISSFDGSAAAVPCETPDAGNLDEAAFGTALSAPAGKFRVTPPIPKAKIDAVPRINFLICTPLSYPELLTQFPNSTREDRVSQVICVKKATAPVRQSPLAFDGS